MVLVCVFLFDNAAKRLVNRLLSKTAQLYIHGTIKLSCSQTRSYDNKMFYMHTYVNKCLLLIEINKVFNLFPDILNQYENLTLL